MSNNFATRYGGEEPGYLFNSQTHVFGRSPHTTVTPFIHHAVVHPPSGTFTFGNKAQIQINPRYHKLGKIFLKVTIDELKYNGLSSDSDGSGYNQNSPTNAICWRNALGYILLKKVEMVVGTESIFQTDGLAMFWDHEFSKEDVDKYGKEYHYYRDLSASQALTKMVEITDSGQLEMIIPISLPHDDDTSKYISMNNLTEQMYLHIDLAELKDLVYATSTVVTDSSGTTGSYDYSLLSSNISKIELLTDMYELTPGEYKNYSRVSETHMIRHFNFQKEIPILSGTQDINLQLSSLAPTNAILVLIEDNSATDDVNGFFSKFTSSFNSLKLTVDGHDDLDKDIFTRQYLKDYHMPQRVVNRRFAQDSDGILLNFGESYSGSVPTGIINLGAGGTKHLVIYMDSALSSGGKAHVIYSRYNFLQYDGQGRMKVQWT